VEIIGKSQLRVCVVCNETRTSLDGITQTRTPVEDLQFSQSTQHLARRGKRKKLQTWLVGIRNVLDGRHRGFNGSSLKEAGGAEGGRQEDRSDSEGNEEIKD